MNILLVNSFPVQVVVDKTEPLNLCYMASFLRNKGHPTEIFHMLEYNKRQIRQFLEEIAPRFDLIGFSTYTANYRSAKWLTKKIKELYPNKYVVFGGHFITAVPKLLKDSGADFAVRGEGELTLLELIENLEGGRNSFSEIKGLVYSEADEIKINQRRPLMTNLDELPFAYREGLPYENYRFMASSAVILGTFPFKYGIYASRGCIYTCKYCASPLLWLGQHRSRSPENVIEEIRFLKEKYKTDVVMFQDADFCLNREQTFKFCKLMRESEVNIKWFCQTSPSGIDRELVKATSEAGCKGIAIGIETGSPEVALKASKVQPDLSKTLDVISYIREIGMSSFVFFIIGLPWESRKSLQDTRRLLTRLDADVAWFSFARPFPGTVLYKIARKHGWVNEQSIDQISFMTYPSLPTFHMTKWQVWKGLLSCFFAFYARPTYLKYLWKKVYHQPLKAKLSAIKTYLLDDLARMFTRGLKWDIKKLLAKVFGKDPLEFWS